LKNSYNVGKRIYIHCKTPQSGIQVCNVLSYMMTQECFGIKMFKIWGPGSFSRSDSIIVYTLSPPINEEPMHYPMMVIMELDKRKYQLAPHFAQGLPAGVASQNFTGNLQGIGVADDPPQIGFLPGEGGFKLQSFGSFFSDILFMVLFKCGKMTFNDFVIW